MILPLRSLGLLTLALLIGGALLLGIARAGAQQTPRAGFPLPAADGCWQGLCLAGATASDALAALNAHPAIVPGSATRITTALSTTDGVTLHLLLAQDRAPLLITLGAANYTLQREPPVLPLFSAGDLLYAIGTPARISLLDSRRVALIFPERGLRAQVRPAAAYSASLVRLLPEDAVIALEVFDPAAPPPESALYYPLFQPWTGWGTVGRAP